MKRFPHKYKALNFIPKTHPYKEWGTVAHEGNLEEHSEREIQTVTPGVGWSSSLAYSAKLKANKRPCLSKCGRY